MKYYLRGCRVQSEQEQTLHFFHKGLDKHPPFHCHIAMYFVASGASEILKSREKES